MKKFVIILSALMLTLFSVTCFAKSVTVSGSGTTEAEAKSDALRCAIENAAGVLIDSQTWIDKFVVIEDKITSRSRGFISNYNVTNSFNDNGIWKVTINADVVDDPTGLKDLMSALTREGLIQDVLRNPRIAVIIPEKHIDYKVPDPAGETAVVKKFVESGFSNMVDISAQRVALNRPLFLTDEELEQLAQSLQTDILIVGEGFSEGTGDAARFLPGKQSSGIQSCRARIEAKMYYARTGQIIAADGKYGSGADISQSIAGKKALAKAGEALGEYFVGKVMEMAGSGKTHMEMVVFTSSFQNADKIMKALEQIGSAKDVQMTNYADGKATFVMRYSGSPQSLFNQLQRVAECSIEMHSSNYNNLTISAY